MYDIPAELKYTDTHNWLEKLENNQYRIGITDFAQDELGDIVYVEVPELQREYSQSDECAVVESVKSTSDIYCPLSGLIIKINTLLDKLPETINSDPYNEGWIFIIQATDVSELHELIDATAYFKLIKED